MTPDEMDAAISERRPAIEEISGLIERITFHNDESGFCVLRVKTPGRRDETTVKTAAHSTPRIHPLISAVLRSFGSSSGLSSDSAASTTATRIATFSDLNPVFTLFPASALDKMDSLEQ